MRAMTMDEIHKALTKGNWASICTVDSDMRPYAIEATYFFNDNNQICFMINPRGTTLKNILHNPHILLKITHTNPSLSEWTGVSCFGKGKVITDMEQMKRGWELLGKVMDTDYSAATEKFCKPAIKSPFLAVEVKKMTGRCSNTKGMAIDFALFK